MLMELLAAWERDYDVMSPDYVTQPYPVWDEMRTTCPRGTHRPPRRLMDGDHLSECHPTSLKIRGRSAHTT